MVNRKPSKPRVPKDLSLKVVMPVDPNTHHVIVPFLGHWTTNNYRKGYGWHTGIDYIGNDSDRGIGDSVFAVADGVVWDSSPTLSASGYGNMVLIYHPQHGVWSRYAHLLSRSVKYGQVVKAGMEVGKIGQSGTDNVHLHFDIFQKEPPWARWLPPYYLQNGVKENSRTLALEYFKNPLAWLTAKYAGNPVQGA